MFIVFLPLRNQKANREKVFEIYMMNKGHVYSYGKMNNISEEFTEIKQLSNIPGTQPTPKLWQPKMPPDTAK